MSLLLLFLFLFFLTASDTDLKTGKVRNKDILLFLSIGILFYIVFFVKGYLSKDPSAFMELKFAGTNVLLAFVVSFFIRSVGIWPAGDAKAYVVANLLIPLAYYKHVYFSYFPGFTLLVNIFMAGIVYIFFKSAQTFLPTARPFLSVQRLSRILMDGMARLSSEWLSYLKEFSSYLIIYFAMNFISLFLFSKSGSISKMAPQVFFVILFFVMRTVGGYVNKYLKGINHFELYSLFIFFAFYMNNWSLLKTSHMLVNMSFSALKFIILYGIIQQVADYYINKAQTLVIDPMTLKEGDLPTQKFIQSLSAETRSKLRITPEGLSSENLAIIMSDIAMKPGGGGAASVYQPTPFVPIIFAGVLYTVITGVSSVEYLKVLLFY